MIIDARDHHSHRMSSSAWKNTDVVRGISFARRSPRILRSNASIHSGSRVVKPRDVSRPSQLDAAICAASPAHIKSFGGSS